MRLVHVASEMFPYIKTGGLADVVGALGNALAARGHDVTVFLPGYRALLESPAMAGARRTGRVTVRLGPDEMSGEIHTLSPRPGLTVHAIARDEFFDRRHLYWNGERDYDDNDARFIFFAKAAIEVIRMKDPPVDVVHCHDWQTGLVPLLLRHAEQRSGRQLARRTVFTVHNMIFQGVLPRRAFALTGLHDSLNAMEGIEYYDRISTLKAGLTYADRVTTVSANYAREILEPEHAYGLEGVVRFRAAALRGIRNGIDRAVWNPATDPLIAAQFSADQMDGKGACRRHLLAHFGWKPAFAGPLFCIVSRMTQAKGHDLVLGVLGRLRKAGAKLVVLGNGEALFEQAYREEAERHPEFVAVDLRLDETLSHAAFAGGDFFLMPSRTEPCGLTQMYAQTYGTIPLAASVGGLVDTVSPVALGRGTGLMFKPGAAGFAKAIERAMKMYSNAEEMAAVRRRAMLQNFSWESVIGKYEELYRE